jgi:2-polyprenyl-3-methyl-5-hydroxy-6-metoxy-1,4-benzoquinol methylase
VSALLLTIATSHAPATDLGYLLHKNPARHHTAEFGFGTAHVVFPVAARDRCQAAVLLEIDPVGLVRGGRPASGLAGYVNDRPYVASSFLSVAIGRLFSTAMTGRSKERQELASEPIPLEIGLPTLPCRGGEAVLGRLFGPLGYDVAARSIPLDAAFADGGDSLYWTVTLTATITVRDALEQLYVLLPVLDDDKHYYVGADEVAKLLRRAGRWLAAHPDRELITRRYLRHDRQLTRAALAQLTAEEAVDPDRADDENDAAEEAAECSVGRSPRLTLSGGSGERPPGPTQSGGSGERPPGPTLQEQRISAVVDAITATRAQRVADLGCGSGKLIARLLKLGQISQVTGLDVSHHALQAAARRLHLDEMSPRARARVELLHGSLTYADPRLRDYDAAALVEVIEHIDPIRLGAFEQALFGYARPGTVLVTTPNAEYNALFEGLPAGRLRHGDHRFEWTRAQLRSWADGIESRFGYRIVTVSGIGPEDAVLGCPTQLAVFGR